MYYDRVWKHRKRFSLVDEKRLSWKTIYEETVKIFILIVEQRFGLFRSIEQSDPLSATIVASETESAARGHFSKGESCPTRFPLLRDGILALFERRRTRTARTIKRGRLLGLGGSIDFVGTIVACTVAKPGIERNNQSRSN